MMSDYEEETQESELEILKAKHKSEVKLLIAKTQQLKKSVNNNKKRKKEVSEEILKLERELKEKHTKEKEELIQNEKAEAIVNGVSDLEVNEIEDGKETLEEDCVKKISKAEKRRQKKADASRQREQMIREAEKNNQFCARNVEADKIKSLLRERGLTMVEISPDGNCLFASIAHQLEDGMSVSTLRIKAANFMRDHLDDFAPFMTDPKTGETLTQVQFDDYCHQLISSPVWGGQLELRALSQAMERKIEVLQADCAPLIFGDEYTTTKPLHLAYYRHYYGLGEHYNSVSPLVGNS